MKRVLTLSWFLLIGIFSPGISDANTGTFWHISDIHYDSVVNSTRSCVQDVEVMPKYGSEFCDSNLRLVESAIKAMKRINSRPDFILWTGDSALHYWNYTTSSPVDVGTAEEIVHILTTVSLLINESFPDTQVIAPLGNHDFVPDNQLPAEINEIYTNISILWEALGWFQGTVEGELSGSESFKRYGSYSVSLPSGLLATALNTNYYYLGNKVFSDLPDDPGNQFATLERLLKKARSDSTKLLISAHVPFGVGARGDYIHMYGKYNARFVSLVREYHDVIMGPFFGHEHNDAFKLVFDESGSTVVSTAFLAPSITPWRLVSPGLNLPYHNPGIRLVEFSKEDYGVTDYTQYYFDLKQANLGHNVSWEHLYTFTEAFDVPDARDTSALLAAKSIRRKGGSELTQYLKNYYCKKTAEPCDDKCRAGMSCAIFEVDHDKAAACVKALNEVPAPSNAYRAYGSMCYILSTVLMLLLNIAPYSYILTSNIDV